MCFTLVAATFLTVQTQAESLLDSVVRDIYKNQHSKFSNASFQDKEHENVYKWIERTAIKFQSMMSGFSEGFYDDPSVLVNDKCFNKEAIDSVYNLIEGF